MLWIEFPNLGHAVLATRKDEKLSTDQNKRLPVGFESNAGGEKDVGFYAAEAGKKSGASPGYQLLEARGGSCSAMNSPTAPARCHSLTCIHLKALDNHGPVLRFLM